CGPRAGSAAAAWRGAVLRGPENDRGFWARAPLTPHGHSNPPKEGPGPPPPAPAAAKRFAVPDNTAVQLPSPADIDLNHAYSLVEPSISPSAATRRPASPGNRRGRPLSMSASRAPLIFRR